MKNIQVRRAPALAILSANLDELIALPDPEAAAGLDGHVRALDDVYRRGFVERGVILRQFRDRKLWKHLGYSTFDTWIASACPWSRADCYAAMKVLDELAMDIPVEQLKEIPRSNIRLLRSVSSGVRSKPEILKAARTMSERNFSAHIAETEPNQHFQHPKDMHFHPGRSWAKTIEKTIAYALDNDIAGTRDEALLRMAETSLEQWELDEELKTMPKDEVKVCQ